LQPTQERRKAPQQSDYCDTCSELKQQISSGNRTIQDLLDSGNSDPASISRKEVITNDYAVALTKHTEIGEKEQEKYKTTRDESVAAFKDVNLSSQTGRALCASRDAVIGCDFQMGKLVPHWGQTAQPGKTYYYQKILHHVFGIVNSSSGPDKMYVMDETVAGEKNTNHVCSHLYQYVMIEVPLEFKTVRIYLDSAGYFKNSYMIWWAAEMVSQGRFTRVVFVFMVSGHTKFECDQGGIILFNIIIPPRFLITKEKLVEA